MIAIHTKYLCPTNANGSRIKAYVASYGGKKGFETTIPYDHSLDGVDVHFKAVKALIVKNNLDWDLSDMRYGDSADAKGFSFCFNCSKVEVQA
jgi:hypothetical protein